jgi:general secretion pathway protein D
MERSTLIIGASIAAMMLTLCVAVSDVAAASLGPVLTSISVTQATATRLILAFSPATPLYRVSSQDRRIYSIVLPDVAQSASVAQHNLGAGLLSSIDVSKRGRDLIIQIHATSASGLVVTRLPTLLELDFSEDAPAIDKTLKGPQSALATAPKGDVSTTLVLRLKYADLSEAAQILTGQLISDSTDQSVPTSVLGQSTPIVGVNGGGYSGTIPPQSTFNSQIQPAPSGPLLASQRINDHVAIDRRLNALILSGTSTEVAQLRSVIEQLDIPDAPSISILLETEIVELTENAARKLGLDIANNGAAVTASLESRSLNPTQSQLNVQAQLYLQIANGGGKLLAKPRVQTANGMTASILTGDAIPILTTITYPGSPPTIQQQLQYVNVGVHLQVQPFASASGIVTTRVLAEVSNVTGFIQGNIPQISQRQASTVARVKDGQSFIVGGLLQDNEIRAMSKIPILGDLPVIGPLFRTNQLTKQKTNLYIILTPHIVSISPGS